MHGWLTQLYPGWFPIRSHVLTSVPCFLCLTCPFRRCLHDLLSHVMLYWLLAQQPFPCGPMGTEATSLPTWRLTLLLGPCGTQSRKSKAFDAAEADITLRSIFVHWLYFGLERKSTGREDFFLSTSVPPASGPQCVLSTEGRKSPGL